MRLILIRHGESQSNIDQRIAGRYDSPLTDHGRHQAEATARWLSDNARPAAIYTSPLSRAFDTASCLAQPHGLTPVIHPHLAEVNFGQCENLTEAELTEKFPAVWEQAKDQGDLSFGWPGGETRRLFYARVSSVFKELLAVRLDGDLVVVSHGGVLSSYLAELVFGQPQDWRRLPLSNCSVTILDRRNLPPSLIELNNTAHLNGH